MRILWFDILFILYFTYISSSENKELQSLVDNGKIEKADSLYKELLKIEGNNPGISIEYANIIFNKSKNAVVNLSMGKLGSNEKGFNLIDSTGKEAAKMTESVSFDTVLTKKSIGILKNAMDKFPDRLDIRFGIAYMYQQLDDFDNQFKVISETIKYGKNNLGTVRWIDGKETEIPPAEFLPAVLYDYSLEEYNKETETGDLRYLKLSELLSDNFPEHPMSFKNIAFYYYNVKNWDKALFYFEKARDAHPKDINVLYNLAENYIMLKQVEKGKSCLKMIIKLDSDEKMTEYAKNRLDELK